MSSGADRSPPPSRGSSDGDPSLWHRFWTDETGPLMFIREVMTSVLAVTAVGMFLFAASGVWPPMVAVESGSMQPHMQRGDLIFITEPGRFIPPFDLEETGVVTYRIGQQQDYTTFGDYGSVVVYRNPERRGPPIIHRARFHVQEGENWYPKANKAFVGADNCAELLNCPAPHDGFITKGDANPLYDQANGISSPVRQDWLIGIARIRIPYLGWVRLGFSDLTMVTPVVADPGTDGLHAREQLPGPTDYDVIDHPSSGTPDQHGAAPSPSGSTGTPVPA